jgi:DNA-directed RNA polymerase specialized sigma24 family protein
VYQELLAAFATGNDQAAFTTLVERHGPLAMGGGRRVLRHPQDAEDAFQATFILLARRSTGIRRHESLASWLHGVAYRLYERAGHTRRGLFGDDTLSVFLEKR